VVITHALYTRDKNVLSGVRTGYSDIFETENIEGTGIAAVCSKLSVVCIRSGKVNVMNIKVVKIWHIRDV
jgi:hypothetical protein